MPTYKARHFKFSELSDSDIAERHGLDNTIPPFLMDRAFVVLEKMDMIRDLIGQPIHITSGYRSPLVNKEAGSGATSDHRKMLAVDFKVKGVSPYIICKMLIPKMEAIGIYQIIREFNTPGTTSGWTHVGFNPETKEINRIITINRLGTFIGIGNP
jgi:zinc D-Ala-D-Ala carboxypeptidase